MGRMAGRTIHATICRVQIERHGVYRASFWKESIISKINGLVSKITDLQGFVASYIKDKKNPAAATFKPFSNVRVTLATDFPAGFSNSFLPTTALNATADATGKFQIDTG